jgi:hypothetical protein
MENNNYETTELVEEEQLQIQETPKSRSSVMPWAILGGAIIVGASLIVSTLIYTRNDSDKATAKPQSAKGSSAELPVTWGDLGKRMVEAGVIDQAAFESLYASRGGMDPDMQAMLAEEKNGKIRLTPENSGTVLNMLWALGLSQKSDVLEKGEMADPRYGDPSGFASTGGWTLAKGSPMSHYSMHEFFVLDADAKAKVERVTKNIYRPCCGNSTHFPDCNHGMAMLGLMELMASQGASEEEMYKAALQANIYWFPQQYEVVETYLASKGSSIKNADPKEVVGSAYSSGTGFNAVAKAVEQLSLPQEQNQPPRQSGGCGV